MPVLQSAFTLNSNEIFGSIANMIISQQVFADNINKHQTLVDKARVDGGLYGDKKLYYATDVLKTVAWGNDSEAANLLSLDRPSDPKVQDITLNVFRQIRLTVDNYLSKRAWSSEGAFSSFQSVMLGWMNETKKVYDGTIYNTFIGTTYATGAAQTRSVTLSGTGDGQAIAKEIADLLVEMGDYSRSFNDYGFLRSYAEGDIKVVWNSIFVNKINKLDLPTIFHKDGLVDKMDQDILPARYFGTVVNSTNVATYSAASATTGKPLAGTGSPYTYTPGTNHANGCIRTLKEIDIKVSSVDYHLFPGDEIPSGASVITSGAVGASGQVNLGDVYIEDAKVICKVLVKLPPYMSAFEVGTSFFNPRSLTENHYLTFGRNTLQYLKNYPFITIKKA